jgi:hypothetical protein
VDAQGARRRHWASPAHWVTCALGPYNFEFMTEVVREITTLYRPDGIFANRWEGHGPCYCDSCGSLFRAASGFELPREFGRAEAPAVRAWHRWRNQRLFDLWTVWDEAIKKIAPGSAYIPNAGGGAASALDMKQIGERAPILFADRQARRGLTAPWAAGKNAKEYRATLGNKPVGGITSVGLEEPYRWKDSVQSAPEIRLWLADGVAQGFRPWITKFNAKPYDRRWLKPVEDFYRWHASVESYLRNTENLATVGLVYSQQTAAAQSAGTRVRHEDAIAGWYQALVEARIPFEMVHDGLLEKAGRFRALLLPNVTALADSQCAQLEAYVRAGGGLVATHETSLRQPDGAARSDFGLARLFGVSYAGRTEGPVQNSYFNLDDHAHPLLRGLEEASRIVHGANQVRVKASAKAAAAPLTEVPSYPDLPMEAVWTRTPRTDSPGVWLSEAGAGRVAYFPWDIDRTFWEVLSPDHGTLLANAARWAARDALPVEVSGPGVLDLALWRQASSLTLHLVNLTNPMMMKGPLREILPLAPQRVRLRLPPGARTRDARWLVAGTPLRLAVKDGWLETATPPIGLHEVLAIDMEK